MDSVEHLVEQVNKSGSVRERRRALFALVSSDGWRSGLTHEVLSSLGYSHKGVLSPDLATIKSLVPLVARDEEKLQRLLELLVSPQAVDLLLGVARFLGAEVAELLLAHLRTASGDRAYILLEALRVADPGWVNDRAAHRVVRRWLCQDSPYRYLLLECLAEKSEIKEFLPQIRKHPPQSIEEWRALGRSEVEDLALVNRALATLRHSPDALVYLLRLKPVPPQLAPRMMAAARPLWLLDALELCLVERISHPLLLPLAELGVRLGGKPMAMAGAWLGATRTSVELLRCLGRQISREGGQDRLSNLIWVRRNAPSGDRALEMGRHGETPEPLDAAALVRQLRGEEVGILAREILTTPYPALMEPVLHLLCAVYLNASMEVQALASSGDPEPAALAREALKWADVEWD